MIGGGGGGGSRPTGCPAGDSSSRSFGPSVYPIPYSRFSTFRHCGGRGTALRGGGGVIIIMERWRLWILRPDLKERTYYEY